MRGHLELAVPAKSIPLVLRPVRALRAPLPRSSALHDLSVGIWST